jgi:hypothetical protein
MTEKRIRMEKAIRHKQIKIVIPDTVNPINSDQTLEDEITELKEISHEKIEDIQNC